MKAWGGPRSVIYALDGASEVDAFTYWAHPVWPCLTHGHLDALMAATHLFGGTVRVIAPEVASRRRIAPRSDEVVVALGEDLLPFAGLYAHLTGRGALAVASLDEAEGLPAAVLVATWDRLRVADLAWVHAATRRTRPLGILAAAGPEALYERVLVQAATARLARGTLPPLPSRLVGESDDGDGIADEIAGSAAPAARVREVLAAPSAVLTFVGHSDGVDAKLSETAVLCARAHAEGTHGVYEGPGNCDETNFCHRKKLPRTEALAGGDLVGADRVRARVFAMFSCNTALAADTSIEPVAGYLRQLLESPWVGAVLAPWEIVSGHGDEPSSFVGPLRAGATLGDALASLQESGGEQAGTCRHLLFGDPALRVAEEGAAVVVDTPPPVTLPAPTTPPLGPLVAGVVAPPGWHVTWLAGRVEELATAGKLDGEAATRARAAIDDTRTAGEARTAAYRVLLKTLLELDPLLFNHWIERGAAQPTIADAPTRCPACEGPGRVFSVATPWHTRWLPYCARCNSFFADVPARSELLGASIALEAGGHVAHTLPPLPHQVFGYGLRTSRDDRAVWLEGEPSPLASLPPGRAWLWLYSLSDAGVHAFGRVVRGT